GELAKDEEAVTESVRNIALDSEKQQEQQKRHSEEQPEKPSQSDDTPARAADDDAESPAFEIAHFGVDRRMLVNRQRKLKMYRCWMQAVFRKPGPDATPGSTEAQEPPEEQIAPEGQNAPGDREDPEVQS
ncbi:hypothetical protein AOQ84DRAFT_369146, partial [Glonium stellatum]